jgi:hypothetical protein
MAKKLKTSGNTEKMRRVKCYMDGRSWRWGLGDDVFGTRMFPDRKSLVAHQQDAIDAGVGIVEVEVRLIRWVTPQTRI